MMKRRQFLTHAAKALPFLAFPAPALTEAAGTRSSISRMITLFLCGDVMTGRGIDQILPHPGDPRIYERYMRSAKGYVALAEKVSGSIPKPVDFAYIWGDALEEFDRARPDVRIINLETSITKSDNRAFKGIHYRMHPDNVPCLTAAKIDCCALANNHILDWGEEGLVETLETLERAGITSAGAGRDLDEAGTPAILEVSGKGRVMVFSFGSVTSGIPPAWSASAGKPGVNLLENFSASTVRRIGRQVQALKRHGDIVVASIHWGSNWGYHIPGEQKAFAHKLLDEAGVDVIHGHSSHHLKGIEIYNGKPIVYGCGDFLNDYEGIGGYGAFRGELALMYFISIDSATLSLARFEMKPLEIERFRLKRVIREDAIWLRDRLNREGAGLGTKVELARDNTLTLGWD
jgi:poly-gamma-glutamate synthesis protein (capsule biosynthesis protein)